MKICITGGAGLVGQNLVLGLAKAAYSDICVLDKCAHNLSILEKLNPGVDARCVDLADGGEWQRVLADADVLVSLQAQIGGLDPAEFERNNIQSSHNIVAALKNNPDCYVVHISSSVLDSQADDNYTRSKRQQEDIFRGLANPVCVLRPTLMFGWFDRKHLGWLSRFLKASPLFPVPGNGRYLRQPLYAQDFCAIILSCIESRKAGGVHSVSGKEKIYYIDIIRQIKAANKARSLILPIPYALFYALLRIYALFDSDPPFTVAQLQALVIDELFPDNDWEQEFSVAATPFAEAVQQTFNHPEYSHTVLEF